MEKTLPVFKSDQNIIDICESVASGASTVNDGISYMGDRLKGILGDCNDAHIISVYSVRLVEALIPTSLGVFMSEEEMQDLWGNTEARMHPQPLLLFTFVVLSCMQLTSTGDKREGAKKMGQCLDKVLPEDAEIDELNKK